MDQQKIEQLAVNTIRLLSAEGVQKAKSGHPGLPMGMADAAFVLWSKFMRFDPAAPEWINRDRFILSAGHGSMLIYTMLHLAGYDISLDDLANFRQLDSKTPGHPEYKPSRGVETTTGPLGQGFTNGIGMAIARRFMASQFNTDDCAIYDHKVYCICSDGDLMEGISAEAASLAGHLGLGDITYLYDSNHISIEGDTDLSFDTENVRMRFEAYGWHTLEVDGHDREALEQAIRQANSVTDKPSLIQCNTKIGMGSPNLVGTAKIHGAPMGEDELAATKKAMSWEYDGWFVVPPEVAELFAARRKELADEHDAWKKNFETWRAKYPKKAALWNKFMNPEVPADLTDRLLATCGDKPIATRSSAGKAEQVIAEVFPNFLGGSADLSPSTMTLISDEDGQSRECHSGRNFHFGVREHAMGGILNGMALYGGLKVFGSTFFVFSDYVRPSIRIAAICGAPVTYVFTHDSLFVGEDGPTHQPIEHTMALRVIPNTVVIRPADATESAVAWEVAATHQNGPVCLLLTRHNVPVLDRSKYADARGLKKGAYIISEALGGEPEAVIIATGSEVPLALEAQQTLAAEGRKVRVVSMPSWELFDAQDEAYRNEVLPKSLRKRLVVEAGSAMGWERYAGEEGEILAMDGFGVSGPWQQLAEKYGFTAENVTARARKLLG
jgi:transketolase